MLIVPRSISKLIGKTANFSCNFSPEIKKTNLSFINLLIYLALSAKIDLLYEKLERI